MNICLSIVNFILMFKATKKTYFWGTHITSWLLLTIIIAFTNYYSGTNVFEISYIINLLAWIILNILTTTCFRYIINQNKIYERPLKKRILFIITSSFIGSLITSIITIFITYSFTNEIDSFLNNLINISLTVFILYLFWQILYFAFKLLENYQEEKLLTTKLQLEKTSFELQTLRQQLNPHFLFNSLNSIRALIIEDSEKARTSVTQLSNLLRTTLVSGKKNLVSIDEEIILVKNYLEIEKIRFDEKLQYNINYKKSSIKIPTFIIQLLVENAIKHGVSKTSEAGYINITIEESFKFITIMVENNGKWINTKSSTKIGLESIEKRLQLIYKDQASYKVSSNNNKVITTIKIPKTNDKRHNN